MAAIVRYPHDPSLPHADDSVPVRRLAEEVDRTIAETQSMDAALHDVQRALKSKGEVFALDDVVDAVSYFGVREPNEQLLRNTAARRIIKAAAAEISALDAQSAPNVHLVTPIWVAALRSVMRPGVTPDARLAELVEDRLDPFLTVEDSDNIANWLDTDPLHLQLRVLDQGIVRLRRLDDVSQRALYDIQAATVRRLGDAVSATAVAIAGTHRLTPGDKEQLKAVEEWLTPAARALAHAQPVYNMFNVRLLTGRNMVVDGVLSVRDVHAIVAESLGLPINVVRLVVLGKIVDRHARIPRDWVLQTVIHAVIRHGRYLPDEEGERLAFARFVTSMPRHETELDLHPRDFFARLATSGQSRWQYPTARPLRISDELAMVTASMLPRGGRLRRQPWCSTGELAQAQANARQRRHRRT